MNITWTSKAYGREKDLIRLNKGRHNKKLNDVTRNGHDKAYAKVLRQLADPTYCGLRERLLKATVAGDQLAIAKIELQIRDHLGEPKEAFTGHKDY